MSIALGGKWNFATCYTNVRNDRNSILSTARREMGVIIRHKVSQVNNSSLEESTKDTDNDVSYSALNNYDGLNMGHKQLEKFHLVLNEKQWNDIKPDITDINGGRLRTKLKAGVWTNELAILFLQTYRLPCAFAFKRAEVTLSQNDAIYIIKIAGSCKSKICGNIFHGYAEKTIDTEGQTIEITTRDTRSQNHENVKLPLNGKRRKDVQKVLAAEGSSKWRKRQSRETMQPGETEPPTLPNSYVVRQACQDGINAELGVETKDGRDLIISQLPNKRPTNDF